MTLATDIQSWYANYIIKDLIVKSKETYDFLNHNKGDFLNKIKIEIDTNAKQKYFHPEIQILSIKNKSNEYFLFDLPIVDKDTDKHIIVVAIFRFKEKLFSRELVSIPVFKLVQEFFDKNLYEVNSYISLLPYVLFNIKNLGFIQYEGLNPLINDLMTLYEDEVFSSRWNWHADPQNEDDIEDAYIEKFEDLHTKYRDFEDEKLFKEIGLLVGFHSLIISSVFSMLSKFNVISKDQSESAKTDFLKTVLTNGHVTALFLGLEYPWIQSDYSNKYYIDIRRIINALVYFIYVSIQKYLEMLPRGNLKGNVELSYDVLGSIRQIIEWSYWYGSEFRINERRN
jgi:hypothetical protein